MTLFSLAFMGFSYGLFMTSLNVPSSFQQLLGLCTCYSLRLELSLPHLLSSQIPHSSFGPELKRHFSGEAMPGQFRFPHYTLSWHNVLFLHCTFCSVHFLLLCLLQFIIFTIICFVLSLLIDYKLHEIKDRLVHCSVYSD